MVTRAIERAQKQVEGQNFSIRKHLLEYDDVMNKQRESIYSLRRELLEGRIAVAEAETVDSRGYLLGLGEDLLDGLIDTYCPEDQEPEEWDLGALRREVSRAYGIEPAELERVDFAGRSAGEMRSDLWARISRVYEEKEAAIGRDLLQRVERDIMLQIVDTQWKDHLYSLDHLKEGIGLRGYGQRDPLVEYKKESFALFQDMKARIDDETVRYLFWLKPASDAAAASVRRPSPRRAAPLTLTGPGGGGGFFGSVQDGGAAGGTAKPAPARTGGDDAPIKTVRRDEPKVGRNDPCPCGSGKKYKKCHGAQG
jgi:preprotein translocase subunit SecA